jgi:hypothetical protein
MLAAVTANTWRGKGRPATVADFLPRQADDLAEIRPQPADEALAAARAFAAAWRPRSE